MIYIHWISLVFYTTIIIVAMIRVLMDNRQPAKTMAWMLVLTFYTNAWNRALLLLWTEHT